MPKTNVRRRQNRATIDFAGSPNLHSEIMDKALAVLRAVELEFLFADNSRAEVAIAADVEIDGAPARITGAHRPFGD